MDTEIWKDIAWYEWVYQVSNIGNIKRLIWFKCKKERILKPTENNKWYFMVSLCKESLVKVLLVHRLVAMQFCNNKNNNSIVMHIDNNTKNNHFSNLMWWSQSDNLQQMWKQNRHPICNPNYWKFWIQHKASKKIYCYSDSSIIIYYGSHEASRITGYNQSTIALSARNKIKYKWCLWSYEFETWNYKPYQK
jgi:hypothetical protein